MNTPAQATFRFDDGIAYEATMGRWSALVGERFLDWLALPAGLAWLDDGCGTGSFTEVLVARQAPSSVVGIDPAPAQLAFARRQVGTASVRFVEGDAQALPLADATFDAGVMALVLFFLPDPARGLAELARVVRPGGMVAAYHWDQAGGGLPLQPIIDAAQAEGFESAGPPSNWVSSPAASAQLWHEAGLAGVETVRFEVSRRFGTFEDYWRTAQGSSRLRDLFGRLTPTALHRLRERVREGLGAARTGPLAVRARANGVKGRRR